MKYVTVFHTEKYNIIEVAELQTRPDYVASDFITLESNETYTVLDVRFNHDVYNDRIFAYVMVREMTDEESNMIDSLVTK